MIIFQLEFMVVALVLEFNNENMGIMVAGYGNLRMVMLCYQKQCLKNKRTWDVGSRLWRLIEGWYYVVECIKKMRETVN